jgi:hypothetical protein
MVIAMTHPERPWDPNQIAKSLLPSAGQNRSAILRPRVRARPSCQAKYFGAVFRTDPLPRPSSNRVPDGG